MPDELDELLEHCLATRAEGRPLAECLRGVPREVRDEVQPLVLLADALRQAPRSGLSAAASAAQERRLLAHCARLQATVPAGASDRPRPQPVRFRGGGFGFFRSWRVGLVPAATLFFLVASGVLVGGAGAMVSNARPDDTFYNLKLSWEQTQLLLSTNDAQRSRVFIEIAQNRIREVELLAQDGRPIPEELLLQVRLYVNQAILLTSSLTGREAISQLRQLSELLTYERILLTRFLDSLPAPERATVELAIQEVEQSQQAVKEALQNRVEEEVPAPTATLRPGASASPPFTAEESAADSSAAAPHFVSAGQPASSGSAFVAAGTVAPSRPAEIVPETVPETAAEPLNSAPPESAGFASSLLLPPDAEYVLPSDDDKHVAEPFSDQPGPVHGIAAPPRQEAAQAEESRPPEQERAHATGRPSQTGTAGSPGVGPRTEQAPIVDSAEQKDESAAVPREETARAAPEQAAAGGAAAEANHAGQPADRNPNSPGLGHAYGREKDEADEAGSAAAPRPPAPPDHASAADATEPNGGPPAQPEPPAKKGQAASAGAPARSERPAVKDESSPKDSPPAKIEPRKPAPETSAPEKPGPKNDGGKNDGGKKR